MELKFACTIRSSDDYDFIIFQIYRSDGIGISRASGEIDFLAGVQALNQSAGLVRQLSITSNSFTMVHVPPRSHRDFNYACLLLCKVIKYRHMDLPQINKEESRAILPHFMMNKTILSLLMLLLGVIIGFNLSRLQGRRHDGC